MRSIYLFRNDLRLTDNPLLQKAISESEELLPVFVFDPQWFVPTKFAGISAFGRVKTDFWIRSVKALRGQLRELNSDLYVAVGNPVEIIQSLKNRLHIDCVYVSEHPGTYERGEIDNLMRSGIQVRKLWQHTLLEPSDLPFQEWKFPLVFTDFRKQVEKKFSVRNMIPAPVEFPASFDIDFPKTPVLSDFGFDELESDVPIVIAGEDGAQKRIRDWMWKGDFLRTYKESRNGMLGNDFSSRFSPWLATGSVSPVQLYHEIKNYENERVKNSSTYWLIFELLWRDFFHFSMQVYGNRYFELGGLLQIQKSSFLDENLFEAWSQGSTGIPLVDANMRELNATGFMSNRGRQIVASFLVNNLKIDWRYGAMFFENRLIDYDVASNWGNWAYLAGVGNDPRQRYFNILTQAKKYDENGDYVRTWIPEVATLSGFSAHEPWRFLKSENKLYKQIIDLESSYPQLQ